MWRSPSSPFLAIPPLPTLNLPLSPFIARRRFRAACAAFCRLAAPFSHAPVSSALRAAHVALRPRARLRLSIHSLLGVPYGGLVSLPSASPVCRCEKSCD